MLAARILFLARTRRWAIVDSDTSNARAISGVCSPAIRRRVSATCASWPSAGWQHVKISRRRSSSTGPTFNSSATLAERAATPACRCRSSRDDSRRSRSIARLRAVVMIHPAGLGGRPASGHRCTATANASWTASSAMSMSPKTRTRLATARPDSARNTRSMSVHRRLPTIGPGQLGFVLEGTNLDRRRRTRPIPRPPAPARRRGRRRRRSRTRRAAPSTRRRGRRW